jgi:hypothetical protein
MEESLTRTTLARTAALIGPVCKFVDKHSLEDVFLVIPIVENVFVEHVENRGLNYLMGV